MTPRSARPRIAATRWAGITRLLAASALLAVVGLVGVACTPTPKPVVELWGDSLSYEAEQLIRFQLGDAYDLRIDATCGLALCDRVDQILAAAQRDHPALEVVQFAGNTFTPCAQIDGVAPTVEQKLALYRADAVRLVDGLRVLQVPVAFVGAPPMPSDPPFTETVDSVYASVAASSGGWATFVAAGAALAGPDGRWTATLPCMSFEGPDRGCVDGSVRVRSDDGVHFCPGTMVLTGDGPPACSTWSSGAWRYAARITGYVRVAVGASPIGFLDLVAPGPGRVRAAGWAYDPQAGEAPIDVHVYVDQVGVATAAVGDRPDVAVALPFAGGLHGYDVLVPAAPGPHTVCAYGIDVGPGANALLGCRTVVVATGAPFGFLDVATGGAGSVWVAGWAIDPDSAGPIAVHVYVAGVGAALVADTLRPDVGTAYPGFGPIHGFAGTIVATPGPHHVCAYGIDVAPGANALLGCGAVVVEGSTPDTSTVPSTTAAPGA